MNIGQRIRKLRLENDEKMTLEQLSKKLGVSRQTMSRYETGAIPNIPSDKIQLIADLFNTSPAYIMGWEDENGQRIWEESTQTLPDGTVVTRARTRIVPNTSTQENAHTSSLEIERERALDSFIYEIQNVSKDLTKTDRQLLLSMAKQLNDARKQNDNK